MEKVPRRRVVRRTPLTCPFCFKVDTILSTHLRRVCMNGDPDEEIKAAIAGAREKQFKLARRGAIPYKLLEKRYDPVMAYDVAMLLEEIEHFVVNKPSSPPRIQTEHSLATARPQVNTAVTPYVPNPEDPRRVEAPPVADSTLQCANNDHSYNLIPIRELLAEEPSRAATVSPCVSEEASCSSQCTLTTVENIEQEEEDTGDDVPEDHQISRIQYTKWTSKTRLKMRKAGLYQRHSLNTPMLKEFATYLHETLEIENYKQEVEDVARFLYFMNPKRANLNFVKDIGKVNKFFNTLRRHLKNQTISGYMKHIRRFVRYQLKGTNLSVQDPELFQHCTFFMTVTDDMLKRITKLVSRDNVGKRFQTLMTASKTPTECRMLLEVAKESFLEAIRKAKNEEHLDMSTKCDIIYYLEAVLVLKHLQRPGVVKNMTIYEWEKRVHHRLVTSENTTSYTIIGVQLHKTATNQVAAFALDEEEEMWFKVYFEQVRPTLLKANSQKKEFLVSTSGCRIYNVSNDLRRYHERFQLPNITSQTIRRICETWTMQEYSDVDRCMFAKYLSHTNLTADRCYREKTISGICHASVLVTQVGVRRPTSSQGETSRNEEPEDVPMEPQSKKRCSNRVQSQLAQQVKVTLRRLPARITGLLKKK